MPRRRRGIFLPDFLRRNLEIAPTSAQVAPMVETEAFVVVVTGLEPAGSPGRVVARVPATSPSGAVALFRSLRTVGELPRGVRLDALPARVCSGETSPAGRTWREEKPGLFLYDRQATTAKIATYASDRRSASTASLR